MKVLMFLRDQLPPRLPDVEVLFDRALRAHGVDTDFVGLTRADPRPGEAEAIRGRLLLARAPARGQLRRQLAGLVNDLRIALCASHGYDLIVVRDRPLEGCIILLIARFAGKPGVFWRSFPMPLADRISGAAQIRQGRWLRGAAVWMRGAAAVLAEFASLRLARLVVAQSDEMARQLAQGGITTDRLLTVPMGVDIRAADAVAAAAASEPNQDEHGIVYLGALDRVRRIDVLIEALALVRRVQPAARLVLIGGANDAADVERLKELAGALAVGDAVQILPAMSRAAAWRVASSARLGVSPIPPGRLYEVSSPTKLGEYMALGLPVVATPIPDQVRMIEASGAGVCVPFSAEALAGGIVRLMADPGLAADMGRRGKRYIRAHRSYDVLADRVAGRFRALSVPQGDARRA